MICLQETKCSDAKLPAEVTGKSVKAYPHKYWFPASSKEGYSGVALWSKKEPLAVTFGFKGRLNILQVFLLLHYSKNFSGLNLLVFARVG